MNKKLVSALMASTMMISNVPVVLASESYNNQGVSRFTATRNLGSHMVSSIFTLKLDSRYNEYDNAFRVKGIKSYSNNGGRYGGSTIDKVFDNDPSTHWETGKPNSSTFKNEVIVTFENVEEINRVIYKAREDASNKGFATHVSIYTSLEENGDHFSLVGTAEASKHSGYTEFKFEATEFKRLKFVFNDASSDWASASELQFFREDILEDTMGEVFTDGTQVALSDPYHSLEAINQLEVLAHSHPFREDYMGIIESAKQLYENPNMYHDTYILTASQRGDEGKEAREHKIARATYSLDSFGKYVVPSETIEVYVDADENGVMPTLVLGQMGDDKNGWTRFYDLKQGKNIITAPPATHMSPAAVYIANRALPHEQAYAPRVRLEGGTAYPIYRHGETTPEAFERDLIAYCEKVSTTDSDFDNGVPADKYYNIAELTSENNTITTSALGALRGMNEMKGQYTVADTMDYYEQVWHHFQTVSGYSADAGDVRDQLFTGKFTSRVFVKGPYAWSDWGYTGYNGGNTIRRDDGFFKSLVQPVSFTGGDWGYLHEWGHNLNNSSIEHGEVTNNIYSMEVQRMMGTPHGNTPDYNTIYKTFSGEVYNHGFFTHLAVLMQVQDTYGNDTYGKASSIARRNPDGILDGLSNNLERLVICMSLATETDLTDFFEMHNYVTATPLMKSKVAHLPKPSVKVQYMHSKAYGYKGEGFNNEVKPEITSIVSDRTHNANKLTFSIDETNQEHHLGYEIFRDGKLVGYTVDHTFVDRNIKVNENYLYEIVAYDKKLGHTEKVGRQTATPMLIAEEGVTIALNSEFNPVDYMIAVDHLGNDITSQIILVESNVDTTANGTYEVKLAVENEGITVEAILPVNVVSELVYVSDMEWTSSHAGYGTIKRDLSHNNKTIKTFETVGTKSYEKGVGLHAISELTVDLQGEDFDTFETYVSADGDDTSSHTSVNFEVYLDGKLVQDSSVMKVGMPKKHMSVNVKGANELRLVMNDGGNGISNDRGVWADAKFTKGNCKPTLAFENKDISVKLGEEIDLREGLIATDIEEGNMIDRVIIHENGFNSHKPGIYNVGYTVTDSEGNTTQLSREIIVYSSADYIGDMNWKSATIGWGNVGKNTNISGNPITINVDGTHTVFEKGIGTHANSEIVYDLSDGEYEYLETYVGVDRTLTEQDTSSVVFKIIADGIEVFNSGLMKWYTPAKFVRVPVSGVAELKLVVNDSGNGNGADHGLFADTKLLVTNSKPVLQIPKDEAVKIGENLSDIYGVYSAIDAEDGELTSDISVEGDVDFNQPGRYPITYSVVDSDGNVVTAKRYISVVDMEDFTCVSDAEWTRANCGWGSVRKDLSPSGNTIRLTDENNQEVSFEKGLGTHATSTITYDLTNIDAEYFSSYVGVDRAMFGSVGSVGFEVWLDDEKVADTGTMTSRQPMQYLEVNIAGAKELKLVAHDGRNGNGSDHAVWGDAKFHYANANRVIVDKQGLMDLIEEYSTLVAENYTETSWVAFRSALEKAQEVLVTEAITQEIINDTITHLRVAFDNLVVVGDKAALEQALNKAYLLDSSSYTDDSWISVAEQIALAEVVMENSVATQAEVNSAVEALERAVMQLVQLGGKEALRDLVSLAESLNPETYLNWGSVATALDEAINVMINANAEQSEIEAVTTKLDQAIKGLIALADKSELEALINDVYALDSSKYTDDSWVMLAESLAHAEKMLDQVDVRQDEVNQALERLRSAKESLEIVGNKDELRDLVAYVETLDSANYTNWDIIEAPLQHAKDVLTQGSVTQEAISQAQNALQSAIDGLIKPVVKDELEDLLKNLMRSGAYLYDAASSVDIIEAVAKAQMVVRDDHATQNEVDGATKNLNKALENGVRSEAKEALKEQLEVSYSDEIDVHSNNASWYDLLDAREACRIVYLSLTTHTEDEIKYMTDNLRQITEKVIAESVVEDVDKSELKALVDYAQTVNLEGVDAELIESFNSRLATAQKVLEGSSYTEKDVMDAIRSLDRILNML